MLEVGRVCLKIAGREAGRYCVVVKRMDENFVMVTGPRDLTSVKRRRCNIDHLEPLMEALRIKSDAADSEVLKAYQQANLITKLGLEAGKAAAGKPGKKPEKAEKPAEKKEARPKKTKKEKPAERKAGKGKPRKAPEKPKRPAGRKSARKPAPKKKARK
jgi:large subunit ribosomal protein L14e